VLRKPAIKVKGAAVRTAARKNFNDSDNDKIIGEIRSVVLDFKDHRDYAIVASGGLFTPGKESIVVPVLSLRVSQNRQSFFLPMPDPDVKKVPLMPDNDYKWLSDAAWRARNDALFVRP
jgi:hypothetical protein